MPTPVVPRARLGASLALLVMLFLAGCGGGDDSPAVGSDGAVTTTAAGTTQTAATVLAVTVRAGSVVGGAARQRATLNEPVTIRVTSDAADEVHVHGYNKTFGVVAGGTSETTFVANVPGVFEVEFEKSGKLLFTLEVR
jgi:hypothetical protein